MMYTLTLVANLIAQPKSILKGKVTAIKYLIIKPLDIFANIFVCLEIKSIPLRKQGGWNGRIDKE